MGSREAPPTSTFFSAQELLLLPNVLTLLRVPLAFAFPLVARDKRRALLVLALAGLTDVLDGFVARHTGHNTATGAVLDPIADKLFAASVVTTLLSQKKLPLWGAAALLTREVLEAPLFLYMLYEARNGTAPPVEDVHASIPGKVATIAQFAAVVAAIEAPAALPGMLGIAGAAGVFAGVAYWRRELARRVGK
jgi:cardiolipin synthase (CMP-forming)